MVGGWNAVGAQATLPGKSGSGWQQVNFSSPVAIAANTTYVASYFDPQGHYSDQSPGFSSGVDNPPLHALANNISPDGVYKYSTTSAFPNLTFNATNYYVDVVFRAGS